MSTDHHDPFEPGNWFRVGGSEKECFHLELDQTQLFGTIAKLSELLIFHDSAAATPIHAPVPAT